MKKSIDLSKPVCLDIETTGLDRFRDDITSIQIGYTDLTTGKYKRKFFDWQNTSMEFLLKLLTFLKQAKLVTHNGKFDLLFLYVKTGIELNLWVDTLVLAHVCGEEELGLKPLVKKYFNVDYDIETEAKKGKITEEFISYGLDDVLYPVKLMKIFKKKLNLYDLVKVYKHEMRAYRAYYEVEKNGVPISPRRGEIAKKLIEEYMPYYERLITVADINWNSTVQVASVLYGKKGKPVYKEKGEKLPNTYEVIEYTFTGDSFVRGEFDTRKEATQFKDEYLADNSYLYGIEVKLKHNFKPVIIGYGVGLKVIEKTAKGVPSVSSDVLANYIGNPVVDDLLEYRRLTKLETFIKSWEKIQVDDRIYPSFNITARTGRTTCSNPNLQQIPQDKNVRNLIEARPGWKILECFSGDTEVLTEKGWQRLDSLDKSLKVAQYDTASREISFARPIQYIHNENKETFYYEDRHTSLCATANHNMLTTWGKGYDTVKHKFKEVRFSRGNAFINAGIYNNGAMNELQSRYIVMFTADGSMSQEGYVTFCFSKLRKVERCKYILDRLGVEYSLNEHHRKSGAINYNFYLGKRTNYLLEGFVGRDKKLIMNCIHNLDIEAFLDEVQYWDATYTNASNKQTVRFTTCVKETAEIIQMMCVLQGKKSTIRTDDFNMKLTKGKHSLGYYLSYKRHRDDPYTFMSGEIVDFTKPTIQDVYCVTMPMGTVMIRHNGKISIQGNCDFSQVELRVASMFSGDANMQHAYNSGSDLHSKTTELLFGDTSNLSKQEQKRKRTQAKSCFSGDTEILTEDGFVEFKMYDGITPVAQYNIETQEISYVDPLNFRMIPNQKVCVFENENTSLKLTPNHECIIQVQNGKKYMKKVPFEELAGHGQSKYAWVNAGYYKYEKCWFIKDDVTRLIACFVADGSYSASKTQIRFGFTKKRKIERFRNMVDRLGVDYDEKVQGKLKVTYFTISDFDYVCNMKRYCTADKTLLKPAMTELNPLVYLEEASHWDGHVNHTNLTTVSSTNRSTLDSMQIMAVQSGVRARLYKVKDERDNVSDTWTLSYNLNKKPLSRFESKDIDLRTHHNTNHNVYCVTVPEHNIVVRHNGKVSIQGNCNFGFLYGMSAKTFVDYAKSYGLNLSEEDSEHLRNNFFEAYPRLLPWHEECKEYARKNGHTWSPIGRKRFLPDINSSNWSDRGQAERQSVNSGVQGFASDMCISALSDIVFSDIIDHERCKVLGSVHDAILFEIRDDYVEEVVPIVKEMMEHPSIIDGIDIPIPIIADVDVHQAWGG